MRRVQNYMEFIRMVGLLDGEETADMGIRADALIGAFDRSRLGELEKFCEKNPGFHIATKTNNMLIYNRVIHTGVTFYLCEKDADPDILYYPIDLYRRGKALAIAKFMRN